MIDLPELTNFHNQVMTVINFDPDSLEADVITDIETIKGSEKRFDVVLCAQRTQSIRRFWTQLWPSWPSSTLTRALSTSMRVTVPVKLYQVKTGTTAMN